MFQGKPCLRRDLSATKAQVDGVGYVDLNDPKSGKTFRFYEFEYTVARAFDGRSLEDVTASLRSATGSELSEAQLATFADRLNELGFLSPVAATAPPPGLGPEATLVSASAVSQDGPTPADDAFPAPVVPKLPRPKPDTGAAAPVALYTEEERPSWIAEAAALSTGESFVDVPAVQAEVSPPPSTPDVRRRIATPATPTLVATGSPPAKPKPKPAPSKAKGWLSIVGAVVAGLLIAAIVGFLIVRVLWFPSESPLPVRTVAASPASVYRWFDAAGTLAASGGVERAGFEMAAEDVAIARRLSFCCVEIEGKERICSFEPGSDETHVTVAISNAGARTGAAREALVAGSRVRLAKARYDDAFAVPASAIVRVGKTDRVYVAGPRGRAEMRPVALADGLVTQGIDPGDAIIVDVPARMAPNARVRVAGLK